MTPGERRGALVVLALCALGTIWDLAHLQPSPAPPAAAQPGFAPVDTAPAGAGDAGASAAARTRVDLNRADARSLDALPGIGPVLAGRIVEHRRAHGPFASVDELLSVPGIGPRLLERLRPLVTATGAGENGSPGVQIATSPSR